MRRALFLPAALCLAALALGVAACGDEVTDPDSLLDSAEAEAVMRSAAALPSLPALLALAAPDDPGEHATLLRARELWDAGTVGDDERARARRRLAVRYAAPVLSARLTPEEWADARARADAWITTVGGMLRHLSMPAVSERVRAAEAYLARADAAGSVEAADHYLLLSAAELVETTPRFVARSLTARAALAVERRAADGGARGRGLERARRLKDWAARAVEEEDYLLAIQRAYYALQLVEGR